MSQVKEDTPSTNTAHTEVSITLFEDTTHVEITIPSKQAKQMLYPILLVLTHLCAIGITLAGTTPGLLGSIPQPCKNLPHHTQ